MLGMVLAQAASPSISSLEGSPSKSGQVCNIATEKCFPSIQQAIDDKDTLNGHTLEIGRGTYSENVKMDKRLNIVGEG